MLKPFKATHHFEVVLKTRIVGLIAHLGCREELLSHPLLEGVTSFFCGKQGQNPSRKFKTPTQSYSELQLDGEFTIFRWNKTKLA